jgi:hypothetical protein
MLQARVRHTIQSETGGSTTGESVTGSTESEEPEGEAKGAGGTLPRKPRRRPGHRSKAATNPFPEPVA